MRPYPKILRTTAAADATLRAYAARAHLAPFEALILAIGLLRTKDEREDAAERAYKFAALWHAIARAIWRRWQNACHLHDRMRDERDRAADQRDATTRAADTLRADLESAREATRRADAEVERLEADLTTAGEDLEAERRSDEAAHDAFRAEIERLTSELAEAKRTADKLRIEVERVTEERDTERRLDVTAQEALRADVAREIEANKRLESELAETRAALATKGATERLAERLETIAVDVDRRACACALPADFEAKLAARAPGWKGTPAELRARVITLGFSRYDALATDAAKRAAERGR